ncbi:ABC transporter substrate-binding protein [Clostridium oryzae]|uniref:Multiple sugar-binding protein n=1 Tax=Clostridium oryzae TaxID=1450648 RepID=A0A1V4IP28_9CLOT|nr:extracellular solute-binding protein [Clostridium oryzae]OPJ61555.1 multiple sugar-binding protein precursor [Clostridium oryzae]
MYKKKTMVQYCVYGLILIFILYITIKNLYNNSNKNKYTNNKKDIELVFMSSWGGMDTKAEKLEEVLRKFEKENKHIKVINKSRGNDDFLFTLKTDFAQGNEPDVFGLWPGSDMEQLVRAGKIADLTNVLNKDTKWKNSFYKSTWKYDSYQDRIYGIPDEIIYEGLFINNNLFKKYNVKIPRTYDELLNAVRSFKSHNIIPIAYNCTAEGTYLYQNIVMKLGGRRDTENPYTNSRIKPCYVKALYCIRQLYEKGAFPKNAFTIDDRSRNELFLEKKAAMIAQGSWFIGDGAVNINDTSVDVIPFPKFKDGKADESSVIYGIGNGNFHMSQKAYKKKRKAALKLLKFLTSYENSVQLISSTGSISNTKGEDGKIQNRFSVQGNNLIKHSKELVEPADSIIRRSSWENILVKSFPEMLTGKIKPEDIFKKIQQND